MAKNHFRVIDSDLHTMEPDSLWAAYLDEPFKKYASWFTQAEEDRPEEPGLVARHPHFKWAAGRGYDPESHLRAMDIEGIDIAILYGTRGRHVQMRDDMDPALAAALARAHNNWTRDFCSANRDRLKFAAQLSLHSVELAVEEARRAVRDLGAVAVIGNPNPIRGRHIHDPCFEPLWSALEELKVPIGFHPTGVWSLKDDIARRFLGHPCGHSLGDAARNPIEVMLALASLAGGGVLERHPGLRCIFLEGTCGWLPWWLWRLDDTWNKFGPPPQERIPRPPSEYFYRQCYVSTDASEKMLRQVLESVGDDNLLVGTDYPHTDSLFPQAISQFVGLDGIPEGTKRKLLWDNAALLYGLDSGTPVPERGIVSPRGP